MSEDRSDQWFWCLRHQTVEPADGGCADDQRMGPYSSREEAAHWREQVEARNEKWEAEDRKWEGDDD